MSGRMPFGIKLQPVPKNWDPELVASLEKRYRASSERMKMRRRRARPVPDLTTHPIGPGPFGTAQVRSLTGLTSRQISYWRQIGLVRPSVQATGGTPGKPALYAPEDVERLRGMAGALQRGMTTQAIHKSTQRATDVEGDPSPAESSHADAS